MVIRTRVRPIPYVNTYTGRQFKKRFRLYSGKFSFGNRVCDEWDRLPLGLSMRRRDWITVRELCTVISGKIGDLKISFDKFVFIRTVRIELCAHRDGSRTSGNSVNIGCRAEYVSVPLL